MKIIKTFIEDLFIIEPKIFIDQRGYFFESFNARTLEQLIGTSYNFIQDNESQSDFGVIRGLHYQMEPYSQAKLVRVIKGRVLDVAVDLRKNSPTYGKWTGVELSEENKRQLLIPKGFAHGFSVLSETAIFSYKCDEFYNPASERGIIFDDPDLKIDWLLKKEEISVSNKDKQLPKMIDSENNHSRC